MLAAIALLGGIGAGAGACDPADGPQTAPAACCGGLGTCVPSALVPSGSAGQLAQGECAAALLCVPSELLKSANARFATCSSLDEAEGRCVPSCLEGDAGTGTELPTTGCAANHECVPCFNPFDGGATGACSIGTDQPDAAPVLFPTCCSGMGRCVPVEAVPQNEQSHLGPDTCPWIQLCVPLSLAVSSKPPTSCFVSATGAEGRCLPTCLPEVASRASELAQDGCNFAELCTPCFDPIDGTSTGACTIGSDMPTLQPVVFASCCNGAGSCVPQSLVTNSEAPHLSSTGCPNAGQLCTPTEFAKNPSFVPPACTVSSTGAEGRCLSPCLSDVAMRASSLSQDGCGSGDLCVPCDDPVTGASTGACTINGDEPTQPPFAFATCCGGVGRCVPQSLVSMDQSHLAADTCGVAQLCVPSAFAEDPSTVPPPCTVSALNAEGRCLPACLPDVAPYANTLAMDGCDTGNLCVPCYDPVDGTATGACSLGSDSPNQPPVQFASCCNGVGRCVPTGYVPSGDASYFGVDTCTGAGDLCVPNAFVTDPKTVPTPCTVSASGATGRCLPECLPEVESRRTYLSQDGCADSNLCVPCFDPVTGDATGACSFPGDTYAQGNPNPALCCGNLGTCLPESWVEASGATTGDVAALGPGTCSSSEDLCVPTAIAADPTHYVAPTCTVSSTQSEGRCLPACLKGLCAQVLTQDGCDGSYVCVPCFDPVTGASTGACHIGGDPGPATVPAPPATCCSGIGTCVAGGLVGAADRAALGPDTCSSGLLCAPTALLQAGDSCQPYNFPTCSVTVTGAEGRCLPGCLPSVAKYASGLSQSTCASLNLCTPCFDPVTGNSTGACTIGNDSPHDPTPTVFPQCCGGLGRCVPEQYVGAPLAADLGGSGCASGALCAPATLIDPPGTPPASCTTSLNQAEGRCLPACLPAVQARASEVAQDGCASGYDCIPCYDPTTGASTGACNTGTDAPTKPPKGLDPCCSGAGLCVPTAAVPSGLQSQVVTDTCTADEPVSCVPAAAATEPTSYKLAVCTDSATGAEGRCLPSCLKSVASQADRLRQSGCPTAELCVPCYDPVTGNATGACSTAPGDAPTQPAVVFAPCCSESGTALGLCVPPALIPPTDPTPPQESCPTNFVCAPRTMVIDPTTTLAACSTTLGSGECVLSCLVSVFVQPFVTQGSCDSNSDCVPCGLLSFASDAGSCP